LARCKRTQVSHGSDFAIVVGNLITGGDARHEIFCSITLLRIGVFAAVSQNIVLKIALNQRGTAGCKGGPRVLLPDHVLASFKTQVISRYWPTHVKIIGEQQLGATRAGTIVGDGELNDDVFTGVFSKCVLLYTVLATRIGNGQKRADGTPGSLVDSA
jgi:hypothetical protein